MMWNLFQQQQINEARAAVGQTKSDLSSLRDQVSTLQQQVDSLTLAAQALWELLQDQHGLENDVIARKMQEIDLRDGVADGKITVQAVDCPQCARKNKSTRRICIYCGLQLPGGVF